MPKKLSIQQQKIPLQKFLALGSERRKINVTNLFKIIADQKYGILKKYLQNHYYLFEVTES